VVNPGITIPVFSSGAEFCVCFSIVHGTFDKLVVLFLDEFDLLHLKAPSTVQDSVLGTFRGVKEMKKNTRLRAMIGVGAFGVMELISPFNAIQLKWFTEDEVRSLFADYMEAHQVIVDLRIVTDIFEQTRGHPGSVGFMGRFIDDVLLPTCGPNIGYDAWVRVGTDMRREFAVTPNMKKLANVLRSPLGVEHNHMDKVLAARTMLVMFLHSSEAINLSAQDEKLARYLAVECALVPTPSGGRYEIPSPVVRAILCTFVLPLERRQPPTDPVPIFDGVVQVGPMLLTALRYFDRQVCVDRRLFKKSEAPDAAAKFAPQENVFQTEFFIVLNAWLPSGR
jgi:hypothetical protein